MTYTLRMLCLVVVLAGYCSLPSAKADDWNKQTRVTFSVPVEIPGQVLSPGSYVFKLVDSESDRHIVQVFKEDQNQVIATIVTIPAYRLEPTGQALMTFQERSAGSPEALKRWFYAGELSGVGFVYPEK